MDGSKEKNSAAQTIDDSVDSPKELESWIALSRIKGVGPKSFSALLERFESPQNVINSSAEEIAKTAGIGNRLAAKILSSVDLEEAKQIIGTCVSKNVQIIPKNHPTYPPLLKEIFDPPSLFYQFGNLTPQDQLAIAIVGARKATRYGVQVAEVLGRGLAKAGVTVVSGLARGIDSAAHRSALEAGGRTIAVLGSGLMNLYPPENVELARQIGKNGAVLSENDLQQPPHSTTFPRRNRIISGLSIGIVVVEAARRSGALITARMAMEQNRDVFAVPGRIDSEMSAGCLDLLADGAMIVRNEDDILQAIESGWRERISIPKKNQNGEGNSDRSENKGSFNGPGFSKAKRDTTDLTENEKKVWNLIELEPTAVDRIVQETQLPVHKILAILTVLQTKKLITRISGQLVQKI